MKKYDFKMYINGSWKDAKDGRKITVTSPIDDAVIGYVPRGGREDAVIALEKAKAAQPAWATFPATKRASYLQGLIEVLKANKDELAHLLSLEHGKPLVEALGEVDAAAAMLTIAVGNATRIEGDILTSSRESEQIWIQRVPYGVTVGLVPWNYPLCLCARKFGNALVCGNAMVIKPPSVTPLTVMRFAEMAEQVKIPAGILSFVTGFGSEMGDELTRNPITSLVSLTGSTAAGKELYHAAADNITVLRLELGGKAPLIVMEDADIDNAVECAYASKFSNGGQVCTCNDRMYIHEAVYDEFMAKFIKKVKAIKVGSPFDNVDIGPKVNHNEVEKLWKMFNKAIEQGAKIVYDGREKLEAPMFQKGCWFPPMVLEVDRNDLDIMHEETFGPVAIAMKVKDFDQALAYANDCVYGLASYLYTKNLRYLMRATQELHFGEIYTNRPIGEELNAFHNGFKQSGVGGEDGRYGMEGYLQKKTVYVNFAK